MEYDDNTKTWREREVGSDEVKDGEPGKPELAWYEGNVGSC